MVYKRRNKRRKMTIKTLVDLPDQGNKAEVPESVKYDGREMIFEGVYKEIRISCIIFFFLGSHFFISLFLFGCLLGIALRTGWFVRW